ncbi:MAG: winged helix-turn-helix domain-containing protein [Methanobrevibacter sp.]|jgi:transposase|nr:winged helix-turn-helix domain-containing protein [Candidatus Methanovirga meridionalis]
MANKIQKRVEIHVKKSKLTKWTNSSKTNPSVVKKLLFIRHLYNGKTVEEANEIMEISLSTGHRWLDEWNDGGYEGLHPKYKNCGKKAKLTDEQFNELDEWMSHNHYLNTRKVHAFIKENFKVDYSLKQVTLIVHKLGYTYKKVYVESSKIPKNTQRILKKTKKNITGMSI